MKVYDYKKTSPFLWCLVLCMSFFSLSLSAQDDLPCTGRVNISIGDDCKLDLTPSLFTEGIGALDAGMKVSFSNGVSGTIGGAPVDIDCGLYEFTVDDNSGNSCWGMVEIKDELAPIPPEHDCTPEVPCEADCFGVDEAMLNALSTANYFDPAVSSGPPALNPATWTECTEPLVILGTFKTNVPRALGWFTKVTITPEDDCEESTIVHYIINFKDGKGNKGADTFSFEVDPIEFGDITIPDNFEGSCLDMGNITPAVLEAKQAGAGYPQLANVPSTPTQLTFTFEQQGNLTGGTAQVCNLLVSYWDIKHLAACTTDDPDQPGYQNTVACGMSKKVLREWTFVDWCQGRIITPNDDIQIIELKDTIDPIVKDKEYEFSTDPWKCAGEFTVTITATDECSDAGALLYTLTGPAGVAIENSGERGDSTFTIKHAPPGEHTFIAYAEDCCGNVGVGEIVIWVTDDVKPFAIAKEFTVTSVIEVPSEPGEAIAKVYWNSIDNGSWDACSDLLYYVRRMDGDPNDCDDKDFFPYGFDKLDKNYNVACDNVPGDVRAFKTTYSREDAIHRAYDHVECLTVPQDKEKVVTIEALETNGHVHNGFDCGVIDNECNLYGEIQYNGDEWGELVKFCCADFGDGEDADGDGFANEFRVELIVFDRAGNWNITWGWVKIEDPTPPVPHVEPYYAYCHDEVLNGPIDDAIDRIVEDAKKLVKFTGVCDVEFDAELVRTHNLWYDETCKFGSFTITWRATNPSKGTRTTVEQSVWIQYKDDFACHDIYGWAYSDSGKNSWDWYNSDGTVKGDNYDYRDLLNVECEPPAPQDLVWDAGPCELIGWTMKSDTFQFETDACKKIVNEWTVIDWCVYDWAPKAPRHDGPDIWMGDGVPKASTMSSSKFNLYTYWKEFGEIQLRSQDSDDPIYNRDYEKRNPVWDYCDDYFSRGHDGDYSYEYGDRYWYPHWYSGVYKWKQLIKVSEDDAPVIVEIADGDVISDTFLTANCGIDLDLTLSAMDTGDCPAEWFKWELFRVYYENGVEVSHVSLGLQTGVEVTWDSPRRSQNEDESCVDYRVKVWDGCGNVDIVDFVWCIYDGKAPTPYCLNLSTALMVDPDGDGDMVPMVELWACDFDQASFDNCTHEDFLFHTFDGVPPFIGNSPWKYSSGAPIPAYEADQYYNTDADGNTVLLYHYFAGAWRVGGTTNAVNTSSEWADFNAVVLAYNTGDDVTYGSEIYFWDTSSECGRYTAGKVFTEDELENGDTDGDGNVDVRVDVWDAQFNTDWCSVQLTLRCETCGDGGAVANVSGAIATEAGSDVASVEVTLDNLTNPEYKLTKVTGNDGTYAFASNPMYNGYDISAIKTGDDDEGVSTLDLVMIQRHILGLAAFSSPYKVIASDINNNGDVSATDLIVLRKLILGIYKEFPQNESWRFVDAGQSLTVENALENFSEVLNIAALDANMPNEDFVAVKIGDVNGDAKTNLRSVTNVRNANKVALTIEDRNVKAGEVVNITFGSDEFSEVYGYQFTIDLNGLQFEAVKAGAANMTNDNVALLDANTLTVSYADINGLNASDNIFTIAAVATKDGAISDMININSSTLNSEAYIGTSLDVATVELTLAGKEAAEFELAQNEPNPFNDFTVVGFTLPEAGEAQITVFNVAGKVITSKFGEYAKGFNQERFTKSELGVSGVLYYTLESGEFTATKKMIIIE